MRSPVTGIAALFVLFVVLIVGYSSVFTVAQTEQVLVVRLGDPIRVVIEPGLNFEAPFIDTVISIDKRILDLENPSQEVIASDQKRLVVDAFARYRIKNALRFYQSVGSIQAANIQLTTLLNASLRRVLGEVTFITVVRDDREAVLTRIRNDSDKEADGNDIELADVLVRHAAPRHRCRRLSSGFRILSEADIRFAAIKEKRADNGGLPYDEVHSVRRLPHRCGNPVCVGRPDICGKPGLDAPRHEERAGNA